MSRAVGRVPIITTFFPIVNFSHCVRGLAFVGSWTDFEPEFGLKNFDGLKMILCKLVSLFHDI